MLLIINFLNNSEAYPEYEVVDIQFAYNLSELIKLDRAR